MFDNILNKQKEIPGKLYEACKTLSRALQLQQAKMIQILKTA